jgi:Protein of unknown function (DUF4435)
MSITLANSKTAAILRSEIILKSSGFDGIFLAVEGDFDSRFWGTRIDSNFARIVHCGGKPNLMGLLDLYVTHDYRGLAAIADADFDRLFGRVNSHWCLSYTDHCDLESTLIASDALKRILSEYGDVAKISKFEDTNDKQIVEHIRSLGVFFGCLRFINEAKNYQVDFDKLSPYKYIDGNSWFLDEARLVQDFLRLAGITNGQLTTDQNHCIASLACGPWDLVQGHDCTKILAIGLSPSIVGLPRNRSVDLAELQKAFRLTFDSSDLLRTRMYQGLLRVQERHGTKLFAQINS